MDTGVLIQIAQLILCLSILVVLHELGHFIPAKLFKTKVEKFYLFFDPWFSIFKKKIGETEYGIGWLPLGGYVKIAGMIDESMDKEQLKQPAQPWEFRSKPAWQRLIIMAGGITVNIILGYIIFSAMLFTWGEQYVKNEDLKYGIQVDSLGQSVGFQNGDKIISIDGKTPEPVQKAQFQLILSDSAKILRNGKEISLHFKDEDKAAMFAGIKQGGIFQIRVPAVIGMALKENNAYKSGLRDGDLIQKINGNSITYFDEATKYIKPNKNAKITVEYVRDGKTQTQEVMTDKDGRIGIAPLYVGWNATNEKLSGKYIKITDKQYSLGEALAHGGTKAYEVLKQQVESFSMILFKPKTKAFKEAGSFFSITKAFDPSWDWRQFWGMTGMLSLVLAFMNVLPIPALDGGHIVFTLWEMITGRKPSDKFLEYAQIAGTVILLALMVTVIGWDFFKTFFLKN